MPETDPQTPFILADDEMISMTVEPRNANGNVAPIDGVVSWSVSDTEIATIEFPDMSDSRTARLVTTGRKTGTIQVTVSADADLGDGVRPIQSVQNFEVRPGEAIGLGVTLGTPVKRA